MISKVLLQEYEPEPWEKVKEASRNDLDWLAPEVTLKDVITCGKDLPANLQYQDGFPYLNNQLYIPANDELKTRIGEE